MDHILFIHSSFDGHLVLSQFWPLWIVLLWIFLDKFTCGHTVSILLHVHLRVELLDQMTDRHRRSWTTVSLQTQFCVDNIFLSVLISTTLCFGRPVVVVKFAMVPSFHCRWSHLSLWLLSELFLSLMFCVCPGIDLFLLLLGIYSASWIL